MPTPAMSVTYTKVVFQATRTSVVTQTTEDTHTLPATAIPTTATTPLITATPTILKATIHTIMATEATPSITIITITIITATNVKMSDYNHGFIEVLPIPRLNVITANNTSVVKATISHMDNQKVLDSAKKV